VNAVKFLHDCARAIWLNVSLKSIFGKHSIPFCSYVIVLIDDIHLFSILMALFNSLLLLEHLPITSLVVEFIFGTK
jgi:hypothetical protein